LGTDSIITDAFPFVNPFFEKNKKSFFLKKSVGKGGLLLQRKKECGIIYSP
jgi:hypothetical protein